MASNCPFWKNKKCAGTNSDYYHYCSLDTPAFQECAVYKMIRIRSAGGGMLDMLNGSGLIDDKTPVAGVNLRRRLSDEELKKALVDPTVNGTAARAAARRIPRDPLPDHLIVCRNRAPGGAPHGSGGTYGVDARRLCVLAELLRTTSVCGRT